LGNLYAAQLFDAALAQNPAIGQELALGQTGALVTWLRENVHQYGSKFTPTELILKVTGKPLSAEPFLRYVRGKFGRIYDLDLASVAAD
jgi:carboxypeptidase Taq